MPGTARYRRLYEMQGVTQRQIAKAATPKLTQAAVSQFELGQIRMTWKLARRLAPAYFAELSGQNAHHAQLSVWRLWFRNVEFYGEAEMKRFATEMQKKVGRDIFTIAEELPLFAAAQPAARVKPSRIDDLGDLSDSEERMVTSIIAQKRSLEAEKARRA